MPINNKNKAPHRKVKTNVVKVDFTDTDKRVLLPEGDYRFRVAEVTQEVGADSGKDYLKWVLAVIDDDEKLNGQKLYYQTSLQPQSLWVLRDLLEALGVETAQDEFEIDLDDVIDREAVASVFHERWEGKDRSKVSQITPFDPDDVSPVVNDDGEEEEGEAEVVEEEEEEALPPPKKQTTTGKEYKSSKKAAQPDPEPEEEAEEEAEGEEGTEVQMVTATEVNAMDDDELNDLVTVFGLSKSLKVVRPAKLKKSRVIAALEKAELLSEE